nr:MAG TPA: hypothetical protein [Bacteriophage sp.]
MPKIAGAAANGAMPSTTISMIGPTNQRRIVMRKLFC